MPEGQKILLVEDEVALQTALGGALRAAGFEVLSAVDGEDAIHMVLDQYPDIVLLDLILPKKTGFEVLDALKSHEKTKKIPVIVLTNLEGADDVDRALSRGATSFLVKSNYDIDEIVSKVRKTLAQQQV